MIYPLASSVSLTADRSIYPPGSRAALLCRVTGYPPVPLTWHKKLHRQPAVVLSPGLRAELDTFPESRTVLVSRLVLSNLTDTDTATYTCTADGISQVLARKIFSYFQSCLQSASVSVQYEPGELCEDNSNWVRCDDPSRSGVLSS